MMAVTRLRVAAPALREAQRTQAVAAPAAKERRKPERRESLPGKGAKGKGIDESSRELISSWCCDPGCPRFAVLATRISDFDL
jgi:hypothetical protein